VGRMTIRLGLSYSLVTCIRMLRFAIGTGSDFEFVNAVLL
jgi:hypothetical protein